jgi:hypothetical protein
MCARFESGNKKAPDRGALQQHLTMPEKQSF